MTTQLCTMCQNPTPNEFEPHDTQSVQPTAGLHVSIHTGYGMFTDIYEQDIATELANICLCHDCSVKLIDMFPQHIQKIFTRGHPSSMCPNKQCYYSF